MSEVYVHNERLMNFQYWDQAGRVKCANKPSFYRAIEHFCTKGFTVDWAMTKPHNLTLYVNPPSDLDKEEVKTLVKGSVEGLIAASLDKKEEDNKTKLANNVSARTGKIINWNTLTNKISQLANDEQFTRKHVVDWFNHYNIEELRPVDYPLMIVSTKSKKVLIQEGKKHVVELFNKGKLIEYDQEQYENKTQSAGYQGG